MKSHQMEVNLMNENSHLMDRLRQAFPASLHCSSPHETIWTLATKQLSGSETRQSWKAPDLWVSFMAGYQGIWFGALPTACTLYHVSFGLRIRQCPQMLILPLRISECLSLCVWIEIYQLILWRFWILPTEERSCPKRTWKHLTAPWALNYTNAI